MCERFIALLNSRLRYLTGCIAKNETSACFNPASRSAAPFDPRPLTDAGYGETHISCRHLERNASIEAPSITHAAALLVAHGRVTIVYDALVQISPCKH